MSNKIIIHICGPSGSGKTVIGKKLKKRFGNKITVKDIDTLRAQFIKKHYGNNRIEVFDKIAYQKYIDNYCDAHKDKPLIFVGLNHMPWWHKNHYYNMHPTHKYFIELDDDIILQQKCKRFLSNIKSKQDMDYLVKHNEKFIKNVSEVIAREACNQKENNKLNAIWRKAYKKQGYIFLSRENIFKQVCAKL